MIAMGRENSNLNKLDAGKKTGKMKVEIQFLGTGDAFGSGGRHQTCIHVAAGGYRFLIDCGASALISMKRWGLDPARIDAILLTHLHGDHFGGIPFLILEAQLISKRTRPLVIAGPPGLEKRIHDAMEIFFPGSAAIQQKFSIEFLELLDATEQPIGPHTVTPYPVLHASGAPSYALRVNCGGKVIAYSGDTQWTDALLKASNGADLFICEAYFFEKKIRYHMDCASLIKHREQLACRRLVVTHMSEDMLNRVGQLEVEVVEDGQRIVL
jgi:ribonuclease BN (tRNA processing enzyme)